FRLDPGQRLLMREGKPVPLTPKGFELLLIFIQNGGRLLTKDELMTRLWKDSFVEEANLTVNISSLRKALGDTQDGQEFIETVPKHGYRFIGEVTEIEDSGPEKPAKVVSIREAPEFPPDAASKSDPLPPPVIPWWKQPRMIAFVILVVAA